MRIMIAVFIGFALFLSVCSAEAADFSATKMGLPSLVMLSTET